MKSMIQKSIKLAIRRLVTHKVYSFINITGLAIAISVCIAILLYVSYHLSFDRHIPNGDNTYRLIIRYGDGSYFTNTFACFDDVLSDLPEVESHTICYDNHNIEDVFIGKKRIHVNEALFVNSSFFDFFSVKITRGNKTFIDQPNTIMITRKMAEKLFPGIDAIGQSVFLRSFTRNKDSLVAYSVTGIVEPFPNNSHLKFEMLLSQSGHFAPTIENLKSRKLFGGLVYIKTYSSADINELEKRLQMKTEPILGGKHGPPLESFNHKLQAVYDIHTTQGVNNETQPTVRLSSLNILLLVGILIFIIAIMNSVIIHVARTTFNSTSTLIMRFHGGSKVNLFTQTLVEVLVTASIGFLLSLFLLSIFNLLWAGQFFPDWRISFQTYTFWIIFFGLLFIVSLAISILSSLHLLKNEAIIKEVSKAGGIRLAVPLVIFQFVLVISLIGFAIVINKQMRFIEKKDLGYSSENVTVIRIPQQNEKINIFRNEILKFPGIIDAGTAQHYPGYRFQDMTFTSGGNSFPFIFGFIDQDALQTLKIKPIKYFTELKEKAKEGWMINETFYNNLRSVYTEEQIASNNFSQDEVPADNSQTDFKILGVLSDFYYASFHSELENFAFFIREQGPRYNRFVLVRYESNKTSDAIACIENLMGEIYPDQPVNYSFLDDQNNAQYASEELLMKLINTFSILAIQIAVMGIMGLSMFMTEKRTKEIGIRKVNGASVYEIVKMLSLVFVKWVGIAFFIATPITFYLADEWLQNFAYRTDISWWIFILSGIITLTFVLITTCWQTFKVARRNPIMALRYE